jgi:hypothetical protein
LRHLAGQTGISSDRWEIVLVDNASTDGTAETAKSLWQALGAPAELRILAEPRLGVIHARTSGILAACYDIVSFVDDDNWVCENWCATILDLMTGHKEIGAIACRSEAAFEPGQFVPEWFRALGHGYAVGPQGDRTGWVEHKLPRYPTAGFSFRRDLVSRLLERGFSTLLTGRSGAALTAGEDAELCYALAMNGCRFWYEESLWFAHYMPPSRLTEPYAEKLYRGLGIASALEDFYLEASPEPGLAGLRLRMKRIALMRNANVMGKILRYRIKSLYAQPGSATRSQARIEASFFQGRLEGMRRYRQDSETIAAHVKRWTPLGKLAE